MVFMEKRSNLIKSTIVGSYPKPPYLTENYSGRDILDSSGELFSKLERSNQKFSELVNQAVDETVLDQEDAGMDIITDGEQRRDHYIYSILEHLGGIDVKNKVEKPVYKMIKGKLQQAYTMFVPQVQSSIHYQQSFLVEGFLYTKKKSKKPIKVGLPGPTTVVDAVHNTHYSSQKELALDYAKAIRNEVEALRDAGCTHIQFDDPGLLRDLVRAKEWGIDFLDKCFEGIEGITTTVHVCRSYPNKKFDKLGIIYKSDEAYYPELLQLLQKSKIDQISIEGKQGSLNPEVLKHSGNKTILLGCIDVGSERVESIEEIVEQGNAALQYIESEHLILSTDCGLLQLRQKTAKAKISNLAEAAKILNTPPSNEK